VIWIGDVRLPTPRILAQARDDCGRHDGRVCGGVGGGTAGCEYWEEGVNEFVVSVRAMLPVDFYMYTYSTLYNTAAGKQARHQDI